MIAIVLCAMALAASYLAARRGLVQGLAMVLAIGYLYGILRANVPQTLSHFIFDAAAAGLYLAVFVGRPSAEERYRTQPLRSWLLLLIGWPLVLVFLPIQDPLVQLVGLRGSVFLLPFLLIGARLDDEDIQRLAFWVAILNIGAFGVAAVEYVVGIEPFFPRNAVTELIYRSKDVAGMTAHRIPSTFTSAHAYASAMAATSALVIGAWMQPNAKWRPLFGAASFATVIGVFMAAARTHMLVLAVIVIAATLSGRVRLGTRMGWMVALVVMGFVVAQSERLQRFRTLESTEMVSERLEGSVNANFLRLAQEYPLGNGLGGGGTSLPYFLHNRLRERIGMENEYARIMLEQGIPGLLIWIAFIFWAFVRSPGQNGTSLSVMPRLLWVAGATYFASSVSGTGLLTAVPLTCLLLMYVGWLCARPARVAARRVVLPDAPRPRAAVEADPLRVAG
jgi:hypothetical protein